MSVPRVQKFGQRSPFFSAQASTPSKIDADFGESTEVAVKKFQENYGIDADGVIGPKTQSVLNDFRQQEESLGKPPVLEVSEVKKATARSSPRRP